MVAFSCFGSPRDIKMLAFLGDQAASLTLNEDLPGFTNEEGWSGAAFGIVLKKALADPDFTTDRLFIVRFVYAAIRKLHDTYYGAVLTPSYDEVADYGIGFALGRRSIQCLKLDELDTALAKKIAGYLRHLPVNCAKADFK